MALEIERRFLVRSDAWRSSAGSAQPLRQGYLAASADGVTVRMRLRGSDQAWLTLKSAADAVGLVRHEFDDLDLPGREGDLQRIGTVEGGHGRPPLGSC